MAAFAARGPLQRHGRQRPARHVRAALAVFFGVALVIGGDVAAAPAAALNGPGTPILDDFNRADEDPLSQGGAWASSSTAGGSRTLEVLGGMAGHNEGDFAYGDSYRVDTVHGDTEVYATISDVPENNDPMYLYLHLRDVGGAGWDGYRVQVERWVSTVADTVAIQKVSNGQVTNLAATGIGPDLFTGDKFMLRRVGTMLELWRSTGTGWTLLLSASDAEYGSGMLGAGVADHSSRWDDFGGGGIGAPPPPPPSGSPPAEQTHGTGEDGCGIHGCAGSGMFADPVNSRTGAFTTSVPDLDLPGTGVSFDWRRTYTSADQTAGRLGPGWTDSYSASLEVQANGDVRLLGEDGQQIAYIRRADGSFSGASGSRSALSAAPGGYKLLRTDQVEYRFDADGRLLRIEDRHGQGVTLGYDASNRLTSVTDAANRQATVSYNTQDLVSRVETADGRRVAYGYTSGRLTSVTDVRGKLWTYSYDSGGRLATIVDPLNHAQVTNVYGTDGRVSSQRDALGKETTFAWDAPTETATATDAKRNVWTHDYTDGVLTKESDPLGNDTELVRDADFNATSVTGPTNETTAMTYDAAGNILTATAPASLGSARKTFTYNARNDVELVTDARGKVTDYLYDPVSGALSSVTQDGIRIASYTYDSAGRVETFTDGNGKTTTYTYFPATGFLHSATDPLGNNTTYAYDAAGRVLTRTDPKGNVSGCGCASEFSWNYTYDAAGNVLTEQDPFGQTTTNVYDDAGRLTSTTDALGRTTTFTYDDADRVLTQTGPDPDGSGPLEAPVTRYTYDDVGNKLTETDPRGNTTRFAYDAANRLVSTTRPDPDGPGPLSAPVTTHTYDANGNLASAVEPRGNVSGANPDDYRTRFTYDAAGRMLTETRPDPDGAGPVLPPKTTNTYDQVGNLISVRDGNDHVTSYTFDAAGRILTVTAPDLGVTTYTYDAAGNLRTRTDANDHTTSFAYDAAGRLAAETSPDPDGPGPQGPAVTSYTYDPNGNRLTMTSPNGNATPTAGDGITTYGYDRANRLTSIEYSDATPDVRFTYDAAGNRLTMADGAGTETRTYDALDRLKRVARGSDTFSYEYDADGNVSKRTYPGGAAADYVYDALNRLTSVASSGQTTSYGYDVASNLVQTTLPAGNGYVETRAYDRAGRLTEVASQKGASVLARFVSFLDPAGNPTQIVRTGALSETQTFTYDASDRLTSACFQAGGCAGATDPLVRWTYDRVGNRLTERRPAGTTTYSYDARDRLLAAGPTSYTYDQNGNQLTAGTRTFAYDVANRLTRAVGGGDTTTYAYDGDGRRVQASTGRDRNKKTNFLWDVNHDLHQLALERDGGNTLLRRYLYGARRISQTTASATSYYHYDPLGSVVNLTSSEGRTHWTWSYEPFGPTRAEQQNQGNQPKLFRFAGEYLDPTGLYHLRARQYDPGAGRFLSPDPIDAGVGSPPGSRYRYADNRPLTLVDPSGETFEAADHARIWTYLASSVDVPDLDGACKVDVCGGRTVRRVHPIPKRFHPVWGGTRIHPTDGLLGYPALDFGEDEGAPVVAVEQGYVREFGSAAPGQALYFRGDSGIEYWYGHIRRLASRGQRVRVGQVIGRIVHHPNGDHLHLGANANIGGRIIGPERAGTDDTRHRTWKLGVAIMREIHRAPRVP